MQMPTGPVQAEGLEVRTDAGAVRGVDAMSTRPAEASPKGLYVTRLGGGSGSALPEPLVFPEKLGISIFT